MTSANNNDDDSSTLRTELSVLLVGVVLLCCLTIPAIVYSTVRSRLIDDFSIRAIDAANSMRRESVYPLLAASSEDADKLTERYVGRSDVIYAKLYDAIGGRPLSEAGTPPDDLQLVSIASNEVDESTRIITNTSHYLYVLVPITLSTPSLPAPGSGNSPHTLGYLHLLFSKSLIKLLLANTLLACIAASAVAGLAGLVVLFVRIPRITKPLDVAAILMERSVAERRSIRVGITGFSELRRVGKAFNQLMDRLDEHTEQLESQVLRRTEELSRALLDAQQAQRYKSALLASHTHGLQMPLFAVQAAARNALREIEYRSDGVEPLRDAQLAILGASQELLGRIRGILANARTEGAPRQQLLIEAVPLKPLIETIIKDAKIIAATQGSHIEFRYVGPELVHTDAKRVFEITSELLLNSCKFTTNGSIVLNVSVDFAGINIELRDTATFESVHTATEVAGVSESGTGLGLSMVYAFVKELGGVINWTPPTSHEGCVVIVSLPLGGTASVPYVELRADQDAVNKLS